MARLEFSSSVESENTASTSTLNLLDVASEASGLISARSSKASELPPHDLQTARDLASSLDRFELNASLKIIRELAVDPDRAMNVLRSARNFLDGEVYALRLLTEKRASGQDKLMNIEIVSKFNRHHHRIEAGTGNYSFWLDIGDGQVLSKSSIMEAKQLVGFLNSNKLNSSINFVRDLANDPEQALKILTWAKSQERGKTLSIRLLTHEDERGKTHLRQVDLVSPSNRDHHRIEMESGRYIVLNRIGDKASNQFLAPRAAESFQLALTDARKAGIQIEINSSWRSYRDQERLYKNLKNVSPVAYPGTSMHEAGLALDIQNFEQVRPYLERKGWYWPNFPDDPWHFEYRL
ncbi:MAG: D-alanyl-D-alanine carboxypeptidase family protein [Leptolyngbya sp.]|nr:D-alanyl-D-alanine carboxypeptidase family protein [Candidatus Melainabacteria bacterium]